MSPSAAASRRNRGILLGALAVLAVVLAAWLLGPALARGRVEQELRRRLGPDARFGALQVGGRGLRVDDLTTAQLARGVSLSVERAQVTAFPPLLLWRPGGAIRGIELDGVTLHLSLPGAGTSNEPDAETDVDSDLERGAGADDADASSPPATKDPAPADDRAARPSQPTLQDALERWQGVSMRALHRLGKGATVRVRNVSVVASDGEGAPRELLSGLSFELTRTARDAFQTTGVGATPGGALDWDLTVEPHTLLAAGHLAVDALPFAVVAPVLPDLPWHDPLAASVAGRLDLEKKPGPGSDVGLEGWLEVRDLAVAAPELHEEPLRGLALRIGGDGTWYPSERRLAFRGDVRAGEAAVELGLDGSVVLHSDRLELETELALPEAPCRVAVGAIPAALRSGLEGFDWSGTIEGRVELRLDTVDPDAARLRFAIEDECRVLRAPGFALPERLRGPFLHAVRHSDGVLRERLVGPGTPGWVPLEQISPFLVHAVLAHEDAAFFRHRGFAPWAIETALQNNLRARRFAYGASTISMQLAKNLFLQRDKTVVRKVREVLLTWYLESVLEKREILALYLNVIEYGPNVYGIGAAADHYFGRHAAELSPAESAFLATVLPAPSSYHRQFVSGELRPGTRQQMRSLLERMHERERIDAAALQYGLGELERFQFRAAAAAATRRLVPGSSAPIDGP